MTCSTCNPTEDGRPDHSEHFCVTKLLEQSFVTMMDKQILTLNEYFMQICCVFTICLK